MKRYLLLIVLPLLWIGCKDDSIDDIFDDSPEHRVSVALDSMKNMLVSAPHGWIGSLKYNFMQNEDYFYLHFKEDGRVVTTLVAGASKINHESTYTLKYGQQIDLVFDSYSIFADMLQVGGDFRFELREQEEQVTRWNTRGDGKPNLGLLTLTPAPSEKYYEELIAMLERMLSNVNKSFYRILTIDGSRQRYSVTCQADILFEWVENGEIKSESRIMDMDIEGFTLDKPFEAGGKQIVRFMYNVSEDSFDVYDENGKVGVLEYTDEKPFPRPGTVKAFMDKAGATPSTLRVYPVGFSGLFADAINTLKAERPDFTWVQLQPYNNWAVFAFTKGTGFYRIDTYFEDDEMEFRWLGTAEDLFSKAVLPNVRPVMQMFSGTFSLVYRNNTFYFVKNDDPRISFIARPNAV